MRQSNILDSVLVQFELSIKPPYDSAWMLQFLAKRNAGSVEVIDGASYLRTVEIAGCTGFVEVSFAPASQMTENKVSVKMSSCLAQHSEDVLSHIAALFDLNLAPAEMLSQLGPLASSAPGLRVPGAFDAFELGVRAILGQLVSVQSASTFMRRYLRAYGKPFETHIAGLDMITPPAASIAALEPALLAKQIGIPLKRAGAIVNLASAIACGAISFENTNNPEETIAALIQLPGIGPWTAHYIAMRALHWSDAFPSKDLGIRKALAEEDDKKIIAHAEQWRPWRSYAAMHLWNSLSPGATKGG